LYYPYGEVPQKQLYDEYQYIKRVFKNNTVIVLPDITKITSRSDEEIIKVIEALKKILEDKKSINR
jgi:histidinol-phosphate/aromatic aminotransferase/cobyric acid decarboxylase-like protein